MLLKAWWWAVEGCLDPGLSSCWFKGGKGTRNPRVVQRWVGMDTRARAGPGREVAARVARGSETQTQQLQYSYSYFPSCG
jgi:hypothetical protein